MDQQQRPPVNPGSTNGPSNQPPRGTVPYNNDTTTPQYSRYGYRGRMRMERYSQHINCDYCGSDVYTETSCRPSNNSYIFAFILLLIFFPAAWIPLLLCQDVEHRCPSCGAMLGRYDSNWFSNDFNSRNNDYNWRSNDFNWRGRDSNWR